jgi:putative ABC transport system substrate-binding protein
MSVRGFCAVVIVGMGMLVGTPSFSADQTGRLPHIGVLWPALVDRWNQAFLDGLRENGFVDGVTAVIDIRVTAEAFESAPKLAEELVALNPDVIVAIPAALAKDVVEAEQKAGKVIPIVVVTQDPVSEGLVARAAHPGGNITGIALLPAPGAFMTKHLQLLKEILPRVKRVASLVDTTWYKEVSSQTKAALEKAGQRMGIRVDSIDIHGRDGLERTLSEVSRRRVDAMIIPPSAISLATRSRIIAFASKHRLPTAYWEEVFANEGGLMSYGGSIADRYHLAGGVVAKILRGAKPADIPVDYSIRFRLVVNLQTAKALRLPIPQSVLIQADEVIR